MWSSLAYFRTNNRIRVYTVTFLVAVWVPDDSGFTNSALGGWTKATDRQAGKRLAFRCTNQVFRDLVQQQGALSLRRLPSLQNVRITRRL